MPRFFSKLFSSDFLPHGVCMRWQPDVLWMHVIADALITLAYLCIPILLVIVVRKRKDMPFHWMFLAFGTFILACGATHAMSIVTLWFPLYRLDGAIKAVTALASITTAVCLTLLLPLLLRIPTPSAMEEANEALASEIQERRAIERELQSSRDELKTRVHDQTVELRKLNDALLLKVEQELRISEILREKDAQVDAACAGGRVATWSWDVAGGRFDWSEALVSRDSPQLGRNSTTIDEFYDRVRPEDRERVRLALEASIRTGEEYRAEFGVSHPDGGTSFLVGRGSVQRDGEGVPVRVTGVNIDVTGQKKAELALHESEKQFGVLADAIPNLAWMAQPDGYIFWYNRRWYEYTHTTLEQMRGWGWQSVHDPRELPAILARWNDSILTGDMFEMEMPLRNGSGEFNWFLTRVTPVRDGQGNVVRWFGTNTDVTEIRRSREALRESESHFRQIANALPHLAWLAGPDGHINWFNHRWYEYTGSVNPGPDLDEWFAYFHPDDGKRTAAIWKQCVATGDFYETQYRRRRKDGSYRWFLGRANPVRGSEGQIVKWFGTCTDIEDYKQAEAQIRILNESLEHRVQERTGQLAQANESLAETRARLQAILDAATGVSIIAVDTSGIIQVFNTGAEQMLQYTAKEMIGICTPELLHVRSEIEEECRRLSEEEGRPVSGMEVFIVPARHSRNNTREWTYVRKDGSTLAVSLSATAVRNAQNEITGYLGMGTDISARKLLEEQLIENNSKLTIESARVVEANRAKSAFLATMSHEIRTPMNAILGMSDLLWDSTLDADQRQYVEVFRRAGNNLLSLINDILDFSKIEAGHFQLESMEFDLEDVVARSLELISPNAYLKGVALLCRLDPALATHLIGDAARLQQILVNLIGNAVKFTHTGEVVVSVRVAPGDDPSRIEFSVKDTGIGIPAGKQRAIFEDFTQANSETTRLYGGTGLGLGICRRLVSHMDGNLTVESNPGEGSTFRFEARFEAGQSKSAQMTRAVEDLHGRRVLVVDDNATNCFILQETLSSWGLHTHSVKTAEEGVHASRKAASEGSPFAVILLDRRLPGHRGLETVALFRTAVPEIPLIILTSDNRSGDATRCRELGVTGYAVKPVKRAELLELICDAVVMRTPTQQNLSEPDRASVREETPVTPLRILIAEDSADNRALIRAYLRNSPHELSFANNGKDAVEQFVSGTYDLILMDMQMPMMDGLTATRTIREIETKTGAEPTPIIALTANALVTDIEASRQAGCLAHLSKPISKSKLLQALEPFGSRNPGRESSATPIWIEAPEGLEEIVPGYLEARMRELPALLELARASDFDRIRKLAHDIKGTGTSYGFEDLTRIGAELELSAAKHDPVVLGDQLLALGDYLGRVRLRSKAAALFES